eukprot:32657-Eustigmatos_ZCMA.PRE.1
MSSLSGSDLLTERLEAHILQRRGIEYGIQQLSPERLSPSTALAEGPENKSVGGASHAWML